MSTIYFQAQHETDLGEWSAVVPPSYGQITRNTTNPLVGTGDCKIEWTAPWTGLDGYVRKDGLSLPSADFHSGFCIKFADTMANTGPIVAHWVYAAGAVFIRTLITEGTDGDADTWQVSSIIYNSAGGVADTLVSGYLSGWDSGKCIEVRYNQSGGTAELWVDDTMLDSSSGLTLRSTTPTYLRVGHYGGSGNGPAGPVYFDDCYIADYRIGSPFTPAITTPACTTNAATGITSTTAQLHGTCTDDGGEDCQYQFEYGLTASYGSSTGWEGTVTTDETFAKGISGLLPDTTYHFRACIKNSAGTGYGGDAIFVTSAEIPGGGSLVLKVNDVEQSLSAHNITIDELFVSLREFRRLVFTEHVRHYEASYEASDTVELAIDGTTRFLGRIVDKHHIGDPRGECITYTAYGLRNNAKDVMVCDSTGRPKMVFNAPPDSDDYLESYANLTVGEIVKEILDDANTDLIAAGVVAEGQSGYVQSELDVLDCIPPEIRCEEMDVDAALMTVLTYMPDYYMMVYPDDQTYHFAASGDISGADIKTYTFGSASQGTADNVLKNLITPSVRKRFTAVEIYGRRGATTNVVKVSDETLIKDWDDSLESDWTINKWNEPGDSDTGTSTSVSDDTLTDSSASWTTDEWAEARLTCSWVDGSVTYTFIAKVASNTTTAITIAGQFPPNIPDAVSYEVKSGNSEYRYVYSRFLIADEAKREIARLWSEVAGDSAYEPLNDIWHVPIVEVYQQLTSDGAIKLWMPYTAKIYYREGRFVLLEPAYKWSDGDPTVEGDVVIAEDVRFTYSYLGEALVARFPASGFSGTAYDNLGIERVKKYYDANFRFTNQTTRYTRLAEELHKQFCDIIYEGTVPLAGEMDFTIANLGKKVNINGIDASGDDIATGFEDINALLYDIRYDFLSNVMELHLSTDTSPFNTLEYDDLAAQLNLSNEISVSTSRTEQVLNSITVDSPDERIFPDEDNPSGTTGGGTGGTTGTASATRAKGVDPIEIGKAGSARDSSSYHSGKIDIGHRDYESGTDGTTAPCNYAPKWQ